MLCYIYKSKRKEGAYLYLPQRDQFEALPESLRTAFGSPVFVMIFNLNGDKKLHNLSHQEVKKGIDTQGFYLQLMPPPENLHQQFVHQSE